MMFSDWWNRGVIVFYKRLTTDKNGRSGFREIKFRRRFRRKENLNDKIFKSTTSTQLNVSNSEDLVNSYSKSHVMLYFDKNFEGSFCLTNMIKTTFSKNMTQRPTTEIHPEINKNNFDNRFVDIFESKPKQNFRHFEKDRMNNMAEE